MSLPLLLSTKPLSSPALGETSDSSSFYNESDVQSSRLTTPDSDEDRDEPLKSVREAPSTDGIRLRSGKGARDVGSAVVGERSPHLTDITLEQLRAANTKGKAWVAIRGKVYNLTKFAARHPGGADIILMGAGKDVTALFEISHTVKEEKTLSKFLVGRLVGQDVPAFPVPDNFSTTLKARVAAYFKAQGIDPKYSPFSFVRYAITVALMIGIMGYLQWSSMVISSTSAFFGVAVLYGFLQVEVAVSFVHDASHGSISHNPAVWKGLLAFHDLLIGASSVLWTYQHVVSHHSFYKLQHFYAPFIYVLLGTSVRLMDPIRAYVEKKRGPVTVNPFTWDQHVVFWGGKAFFFATRLVLPFYLAPGLSLWKVLAAYIISDFTFSFTFGLISQASHVTDNAVFPTINPETGNLDIDWMRLQIEAAQDYSHGSIITTFLVGALNYQAVHHLFPQVAQPYVPEIAPIVVQTAKEFGVKYVIRDNMWDAIGGHLGLLKLMSEPPHDL
ncbi:delta-5 desaturase [Pseudohyphozyma bogoriensis]|nr:delta-5 desaturase [Pseudohyphozyma bogoriensis]